MLRILVACLLGRTTERQLNSMQQVFPEQLTCPQLVKKFPAFCVTRRFITALTISHHTENQRPCEVFRIVVGFYVEEWSASHQTLKLEGTSCRLYASLNLIYSQLPFISGDCFYIRTGGTSRDHWGDLGVDGWMILRWISRRWDVGIWTGLGWPRIETGGGRLWVR